MSIIHNNKFIDFPLVSDFWQIETINSLKIFVFAPYDIAHFDILLHQFRQNVADVSLAMQSYNDSDSRVLPDAALS